MSFLLETPINDIKMVKFQFYEPVSSFASATQGKQETRSTVLRPVRSFYELTGMKGYTDQMSQIPDMAFTLCCNE